MKLNLHIIKHELGSLIKGGRLPDTTALTLRGAIVVCECGEEIVDGFLYVVREDSPAFDELARLADNLLVLTDNPQEETLSKVSGFCLLSAASSAEKDLLNALAECFCKYNRWEEEVESLILSGAGLESVLEMGGRFIGNPMALCDVSMHCLATCYKEYAPVNNSVWMSIEMPGHSSVTLNALLRRSNLVDRVRSDTEVFTYQLPDASERVMHLNIFFRNKRIAYLVAFETLRPFDEYVCSITARFGQMLAIAVNTSMVYRNETLSNIHLLSQRILNGEQVNEAYINFVLDQAGWKRGDAYCVCEFEAAKANSAYDTVPDLVLFQHSMMQSAVFYYRTSIIAVCNLTRSSISCDELAAQLKGLLEESRFVGGISNVFNDYISLGLHEKEAACALRFAKTSLRGRHQDLVLYRNCMLDNMLRLCETDFDLRLLCRSDIFRLWQYDEKHGTAYVDCLYVYLSTGRKLIESAKQLFVHRNTFVYRIGKIMELLGEDALSGEDSTLEILLSCLIVKHLRNQQNKEP